MPPGPGRASSRRHLIFLSSMENKEPCYERRQVRSFKLPKAVVHRHGFLLGPYRPKRAPPGKTRSLLLRPITRAPNQTRRKELGTNRKRSLLAEQRPHPPRRVRSKIRDIIIGAGQRSSTHPISGSGEGEFWPQPRAKLSSGEISLEQLSSFRSLSPGWATYRATPIRNLYMCGPPPNAKHPGGGQSWVRQKNRPAQSPACHS